MTACSALRTSRSESRSSVSAWRASLTAFSGSTSISGSQPRACAFSMRWRVSSCSAAANTDSCCATACVWMPVIVPATNVRCSDERAWRRTASARRARSLSKSTSSSAMAIVVPRSVARTQTLRLGLRSHELVEGSDGLATGDRDVARVALAPGDPELVEGVGEDAADVVGGVAEEVARVGVALGCAAHPALRPVRDATAVGVDEPADQRPRICANHLQLPGFQDDPPRVFHPWPVLRQQMKPTLRVALDHGATSRAHAADGPGRDRPHRGLDLVHDAGVAVTAEDAEGKGSSGSLNAAVAEVLPEQVDVALAHIPDGVVAPGARTGHEPRPIGAVALAPLSQRRPVDPCRDGDGSEAGARFDQS